MAESSQLLLRHIRSVSSTPAPKIVNTSKARSSNARETVGMLTSRLFAKEVVPGIAPAVEPAFGAVLFALRSWLIPPATAVLILTLLLSPWSSLWAPWCQLTTACAGLALCAHNWILVRSLISSPLRPGLYVVDSPRSRHLKHSLRGELRLKLTEA